MDASTTADLKTLSWAVVRGPVWTACGWVWYAARDNLLTDLMRINRCIVDYQRVAECVNAFFSAIDCTFLEAQGVRPDMHVLAGTPGAG